MKTPKARGLGTVALGRSVYQTQPISNFVMRVDRRSEEAEKERERARQAEATAARLIDDAHRVSRERIAEKRFAEINMDRARQGLLPVPEKVLKRITGAVEHDEQTFRRQGGTGTWTGLYDSIAMHEYRAGLRACPPQSQREKGSDARKELPPLPASPDAPVKPKHFDPRLPVNSAPGSLDEGRLRVARAEEAHRQRREEDRRYRERLRELKLEDPAIYAPAGVAPR